MSNVRLSLPILIPGSTYVLDYEFDDNPSSAPLYALFVNGVQVGESAEGSPLGGELWRFEVEIPHDAEVGASARIRLTANIDGLVFVDFYSMTARPAQLVELGKSYRYQQDDANDANKTSDVTVREVE